MSTSVSIKSDTLRQIKKSVSINVDTLRQNKNAVSIYVDTKRKVTATSTSKKIYYLKDDTTYTIPLYSDVFYVGSTYICVRDKDNDNEVLYARLCDVDSDNASNLRIIKSSTTYAVANSNDGYLNLSKTNLYTDGFWGSWTDVSSSLSVVLPENRTITIEYAIKFYNDDGDSHVEGRVLVDDETQACYFYQTTGWNSGSSGGYTVTEDIWAARLAAGKIYSRSISQSLSLAAGTHTFKMQLKGSGWQRANCCRDRSIEIS
ncbi:MAG: hypothetical protein H6Q67_2389 [Firmicutes bacterium]|nr:hypothetical protein [Bacillota bacterium]